MVKVEEACQVKGQAKLLTAEWGGLASVCDPQGHIDSDLKQWRVEALRIFRNSQVEPRSDVHPAWTFPTQPGYPVFVQRTAQGSPDHCPSPNLPVSPSQPAAATTGRGRVTLETGLSASSMDFLTSSQASLAPSSLASSNRNPGGRDRVNALKSAPWLLPRPASAQL